MVYAGYRSQRYSISKLTEEHPDAKMGEAKVAVATDYSLFDER
jgi:hypothetical protein